MDRKRYVARRPIGYGDRELDRGQVFELAGMRNDEKLVRLGYVNELPPDAETCQCAECPAEFVGIAERTGHGNDRHRRRRLTPGQEDEREEQREKLLAEVAPLYLDKTAASANA